MANLVCPHMTCFWLKRRQPKRVDFAYRRDLKSGFRRATNAILGRPDNLSWASPWTHQNRRSAATTGQHGIRRATALSTIILDAHPLRTLGLWAAVRDLSVPPNVEEPCAQGVSGNRLMPQCENMFFRMWHCVHQWYRLADSRHQG